MEEGADPHKCGVLISEKEGLKEEMETISLSPSAQMKVESIDLLHPAENIHLINMIKPYKSQEIFERSKENLIATQMGDSRQSLSVRLSRTNSG